MSPPKFIAFFFLKLAVLYALLLIPWPGVRDGYASVFRYGANLAFRTVGTHGRVYFQSMEITGDGFNAYDTNVEIENIKKGIRGDIPGINTRLIGYLPAAFGISLILATPIPWRRRVIALIVGLALISAFAGFELWLILMDTFSNPHEFNLFSWPDWARSLLAATLKVVHRSPVTAYIVPVVVWVVVAVRKNDLLRWLGRNPSTERKS